MKNCSPPTLLTHFFFKSRPYVFLMQVGDWTGKTKHKKKFEILIWSDEV